MAKLNLSLACWDYDRTRPLIDGRIKPEGIELDIKVLRPRETFPRMLEKREFHVSELSLASYVTLKGRGNCPFVAIPVALSKLFRRSCIYIRPDSGIHEPKDLRSKRVGTTQLGSTGVVFLNGMLQNEYGVTIRDIDWFIGGLNTPTQQPLIPLNLPPQVKAQFLPKGETLEGLLNRDEIDALFSLYIPELFLNRTPHIRRLFPNYKEIEQDYYSRTRIFPIMHTVVIRNDVHREHPWAAKALYRAFVAARDLALDGLYDTDALRLSLPWLIDHLEEARRAFGKDFWSYGIESNRPTWQAIGRYVYEQGLSPRVVSADELFLPEFE